MPDPIEEGQANYSRRYKPIDSAQYQNEQAQAYYERMRSKMRKQSRSIMRGGGFRSTGSESLYQTIGPMYDDPAKSTYRTRHRRDKAYAEDVSERAFQSTTNAVQSFTGFAAEFGVGEVIESGVGKALYQGGARTGFASSYLGSTAVGVGAGLVGAGVAAAGIEGTMRYTGAYDAVSQNQEIQQLRSISRGFTSSTSSGPRGRASQNMSQNIMTDLAEMGRESMSMSEGDGLGELKEQVGILSDFNLMEGVSDAEEFQRKFGELKDGVKKITEILGTTFEEGARMLKDFRNMGVGPSQGVQMLNQGRLTSAEYGTNFRQGHAAGMQSSLAMRGTGFTAGAGYAMGQQAQGASNVIYDEQLLSDRMVYNMGGRKGIQQKIQRGNMNYMQSPQFTATMMGAMTEDGQFDMSRIAATAMGERTMEQNAAAANQNISNLGDMMSFRANQQKAASRLVEANPQFLNAMKTQSIMQVARRAGQDPSQMTKRELAQYAPQVGITSQQAMAGFANVEAEGLTRGRREAERNRVAEGRASDLYQTGVLGQMTEGFREAPMFQGAVQLGASLESATRNNVYAATQDIARRMTQTFSGTTQITMRGDVASQFREIDPPTDQPRGEEVFFTDTGTEPFADPSQADAIRENIFSGQRRGMTVARAGIVNAAGENRLRVKDSSIRRLLKDKGMSDEEIENQINDSGVYTKEKLANLGIGGAMGTNADARFGSEMGSGQGVPGISPVINNARNMRGALDHLADATVNNFTGRNSSENYTLFLREQRQNQMSADEQLAQSFKSATSRESRKRLADMSEDARSEYQSLSRRFGDITEEEMQNYVDSYGDDGGTAPEFRDEVYRIMNQEYDIEGKPGTAKFKKNLAKMMDERDDVSQAFNRVMDTYVSGDGRDRLKTALTQFSDTGTKQVENVRSALEGARTTLENKASKVLSDEAGYIFNSERLNTLQETGTKDLIAGLAAARRSGDQKEINRIKEQLRKVGGGMLSEANKVLNSMDEEEMNQLMRRYSAAAEAGKKIGGQGEMRVNQSGTVVNRAEEREEKRLDKMANMAVDNTADALMKMSANNEKQLDIMNKMLSELQAM